MSDFIQINNRTDLHGTELERRVVQGLSFVGGVPRTPPEAFLYTRPRIRKRIVSNRVDNAHPE